MNVGNVYRNIDNKNNKKNFILSSRTTKRKTTKTSRSATTTTTSAETRRELIRSKRSSSISSSSSSSFFLCQRSKYYSSVDCGRPIVRSTSLSNTRTTTTNSSTTTTTNDNLTGLNLRTNIATRAGSNHQNGASGARTGVSAAATSAAAAATTTTTSNSICNAETLTQCITMNSCCELFMGLLFYYLLIVIFCICIYLCLDQTPKVLAFEQFVANLQQQQNSNSTTRSQQQHQLQQSHQSIASTISSIISNNRQHHYHQHISSTSSSSSSIPSLNRLPRSTSSSLLPEPENLIQQQSSSSSSSSSITPFTILALLPQEKAPLISRALRDGQSKWEISGHRSEYVLRKNHSTSSISSTTMILTASDIKLNIYSEPANNDTERIMSSTCEWIKVHKPALVLSLLDHQRAFYAAMVAESSKIPFVSMTQHYQNDIRDSYAMPSPLSSSNIPKTNYYHHHRQQQHKTLNDWTPSLSSSSLRLSLDPPIQTLADATFKLLKAQYWFDALLIIDESIISDLFARRLSSLCDSFRKKYGPPEQYGPSSSSSGEGGRQPQQRRHYSKPLKMENINGHRQRQQEHQDDYHYSSTKRKRRQSTTIVDGDGKYDTLNWMMNSLKRSSVKKSALLADTLLFQQQQQQRRYHHPTGQTFLDADGDNNSAYFDDVLSLTTEEEDRQQQSIFEQQKLASDSGKKRPHHPHHQQQQQHHSTSPFIRNNSKAGLLMSIWKSLMIIRISQSLDQKEFYLRMAEIQNTHRRVVLVHCDKTTTEHVLKTASELDLFNGEKIWILLDGLLGPDEKFDHYVYIRPNNKQQTKQQQQQHGGSMMIRDHLPNGMLALQNRHRLIYDPTLLDSIVELMGKAALNSYQKKIIQDEKRRRQQQKKREAKKSSIENNNIMNDNNQNHRKSNTFPPSKNNPTIKIKSSPFLSSSSSSSSSASIVNSDLLLNNSPKSALLFNKKSLNKSELFSNFHSYSFSSSSSSSSLPIKAPFNTNNLQQEEEQEAEDSTSNRKSKTAIRNIIISNNNNKDDNDNNTMNNGFLHSLAHSSSSTGSGSSGETSYSSSFDHCFINDNNVNDGDNSGTLTTIDQKKQTEDRLDIIRELRKLLNPILERYRTTKSRCSKQQQRQWKMQRQRRKRQQQKNYSHHQMASMMMSQAIKRKKLNRKSFLDDTNNNNDNINDNTSNNGKGKQQNYHRNGRNVSPITASTTKAATTTAKRGQQRQEGKEKRISAIIDDEWRHTLPDSTDSMAATATTTATMATTKAMIEQMDSNIWPIYDMKKPTGTNTDSSNNIDEDIDDIGNNNDSNNDDQQQQQKVVINQPLNQQKQHRSIFLRDDQDQDQDEATTSEDYAFYSDYDHFTDDDYDGTSSSSWLEGNSDSDDVRDGVGDNLNIERDVNYYNPNFDNNRDYMKIFSEEHGGRRGGIADEEYYGDEDDEDDEFILNPDEIVVDDLFTQEMYRSIVPHFDILNLVPVDPNSSETIDYDGDWNEYGGAGKVSEQDQQQRKSVWRVVGNITHDQTNVNTIMYIGSDQLPNYIWYAAQDGIDSADKQQQGLPLQQHRQRPITYSSTSGKHRFRVVTNIAPPFVIQSSKLDNNTCLIGVFCLKVSTSVRDDLIAIFTDFRSGRRQFEGITYSVCCCAGIAIDLLNAVSRDLHFDYDLYMVADGLFGIRKDGKWDGVTADLVNDVAHLSFTAFSTTSSRVQAIDYSVPFFYSGVSCLSSASPYSDVRLLAFLIPFSYELWAAIFASLVATAIAAAIYEWFSPFGLNPWGRQRTKNFSLASALWVMCSLLFSHLVAFKAPKSWPNKVLINVWGAFSVIFLATYTANIAAHFAGFLLPEVNDFHDSSLMKQRTGTARSSASEGYLMEKYTDLWHHIQRHKVDSFDAGLESLRNNKLDVLIGDTAILDYYRANDPGCNLRLLGDSIFDDAYAVGMQKGFPFRESISNLILKYNEYGYLDQLHRKWYGRVHCLESTSLSKPEPLTVRGVAGVFLMLTIGIMVGIIILLAEHFVFKYLLPGLRKKPKDCFWKSPNLMFFSQKLYRFINTVELVSPHHSAKEIITNLREGQIASLFQKSVKRKAKEEARRRKSKSQFFEMIQEVRKVVHLQQTERSMQQDDDEIPVDDDLDSDIDEEAAINTNANIRATRPSFSLSQDEMIEMEIRHGNRVSAIRFKEPSDSIDPHYHPPPNPIELARMKPMASSLKTGSTDSSTIGSQKKFHSSTDSQDVFVAIDQQHLHYPHRPHQLPTSRHRSSREGPRRSKRRSSDSQKVKENLTQTRRQKLLQSRLSSTSFSLENIFFEGILSEGLSDPDEKRRHFKRRRVLSFEDLPAIKKELSESSQEDYGGNMIESEQYGRYTVRQPSMTKQSIRSKSKSLSQPQRQTSLETTSMDRYVSKLSKHEIINLWNSSEQELLSRLQTTMQQKRALEEKVALLQRMLMKPP